VRIVCAEHDTSRGPHRGNGPAAEEPGVMIARADFHSTVGPLPGRLLNFPIHPPPVTGMTQSTHHASEERGQNASTAVFPPPRQRRRETITDSYIRVGNLRENCCSKLPALRENCAQPSPRKRGTRRMKEATSLEREGRVVPCDLARGQLKIRCFTIREHTTIRVGRKNTTRT